MPEPQLRKRNGPLEVRGDNAASRNADDDRVYRFGETVTLWLEPQLPERVPYSLRARVVGNGERITVRSMHPVYARDTKMLVDEGQEFEVDRDCIACVWLAGD